MSDLVLDNPFWRFSLAIYSTPGVSAECLALQETLGIDVNLLLFCAWTGAEHRIKLTPTELDEFSATVRDWHEQVVLPLRGARQALKVIGGHDTLREKVKAAELESEQIEQAMLYALVVERRPQTCSASPRLCVSENVRRLISRQEAPKGHDHDKCWPAKLVETSIARLPERRE
jgi:uncharacterized protein (TIGR02444 family)